MAPEQPKEFYVGYLPMPRGHRAFLRLLVPTALWGMCALAALVSWRMSSAGAGAWDLSNVVELRGVVSTAPYPGVLVKREDGSGEELVLMVEEGKFPLRTGLDGLSGQRITARGTIIERDGRRMIELLPGNDGVRVEGEARTTLTPPAPRNNAALVGEIVDFKCYLGAMKPGRGVTHRGCAALCVQGGIPPALVAPNADGGEDVYLLASEDGGRANTLALDYLGRRVAVIGVVYEGPGGYLILRAHPDRIIAR